jgi:hypothetical protein
MSKQPITVYFAAGYNRAWEMREFRQMLQPFGWAVTSRWIDNKPDDKSIGSKDLSEPAYDAAPEVLRESQEIYRAAREANLENIEDLTRASTLILFTRTPSTTGGRHTELGMAIALRKRIIVIGPRENVFQAGLERFDIFQDFLEFLAQGG